MRSRDSHTVLIDHTHSASRARQLAMQYGVPVRKHADNSTRFILHLTDKGISLQQNTRPRPAPVQVDFTSARLAYRRGQSELLAKAVGGYRHKNLRILDATAGLGKDAFVLAALGCKVDMIERHPLVYLLLADGLQRARDDHRTAKTAARMSVTCADALDYLRQIPPPDAVYLDPMYPPKSGSAKAKKEMQLLQALHDDGLRQENQPLLQLALQTARYRVAVKRPLNGDRLEGRDPDFAIRGRNTRFDVYLLHGAAHFGSLPEEPAKIRPGSFPGP